MSTRLAAAVALCAATTLLPLGPSLPALAGEPVMIEITDLDSSVPGRLTAIVRTEDPEARLGVLDASGEHLPLTAFYHRELDVADGVARVEVETWGLDDDKTYLLEVATCGGWDHACATATAPFVPTDVTPTVTFSTDPVLTGTEQATVDVEDDGVGLEAVLYTRTQPLRSGQQELRLEEGRTVVSVRRCGRLGCHRFDPTATYTVS